MDFYSYISFLGEQADLVENNIQAKEAMSATKDLINKAQSASSHLALFPKLDSELAKLTATCLDNHHNIAKTWSSFYQSDLDSLVEKIQKLNSVEANISKALNLPQLIDNVYQLTTITNLTDNILLLEEKLSIVDDKKRMLKLVDVKLSDKLAELDNAINTNGLGGLVLVLDVYKQDGYRIQEKCKNILSLTSYDVERVINDIDRLVSQIKTDLEERKGKLTKKIGIAIGVLILVIFVAMNLTTIVNLVVGVFIGIGYLVGGIFVIWIILKILSSNNNY